MEEFFRVLHVEVSEKRAGGWQVGAASAVLWIFYSSVVVKMRQTWKVKSSIRLRSDPLLWSRPAVQTRQIKKAAKNSFRWRSGFSVGV